MLLVSAIQKCGQRLQLRVEGEFCGRCHDIIIERGTAGRGRGVSEASFEFFEEREVKEIEGDEMASLTSLYLSSLSSATQCTSVSNR